MIVADGLRAARLSRRGEPDGEDQAEGQAPNARGELPGSGTAATAAEPALHILERKAMLRGPCFKPRDINRIGQSPRRLVSKVRPPA